MPKTPESPVTAEGAVILPQAVNTSAMDGIAIDHASHTTAKDLFAALLTVASEETKVVAREIGTLLHLHTKASNTAGLTGSYKAGDLNK